MEDEPPQYNIPDDYIKNSNKYKPYLSLADNYSPGFDRGLSFSNSKQIHKLIPICISSYTQSYDFSYPLIFKLRDPSTGYIFKIATIVDVDSGKDSYMHPGDCSTIGWSYSSGNEKGFVSKKNKNQKIDEFKDYKISFNYLNLTNCKTDVFNDVVSVMCMDYDGNAISQFDNLDHDSFGTCSDSCSPEDNKCLQGCMLSSSKLQTIETKLNKKCSSFKIYVYRDVEDKNNKAAVFEEDVSLKDITGSLIFNIPMYWIPEDQRNNTCEDSKIISW